MIQPKLYFSSKKGKKCTSDDCKNKNDHYPDYPIGFQLAYLVVQGVESFVLASMSEDRHHVEISQSAVSSSSNGLVNLLQSLKRENMSGKRKK
jgi:hypothetical protein